MTENTKDLSRDQCEWKKKCATDPYAYFEKDNYEYTFQFKSGIGAWKKIPRALA